jgi:hypothetical protein
MRTLVHVFNADNDPAAEAPKPTVAVQTPE